MPIDVLLVGRQIRELEAKNEQLEKHLKETIACFEDNNKSAYEEGFAQGRSYQAIIEIRGREKFTDKLNEQLCDKCKNVALKG